MFFSTVQTPSRADSNVENQPWCERDIFQARILRQIKILQDLMRATVIFTCPIDVAAVPVRLSLHKRCKLSLPALKIPDVSALLTYDVEVPQSEEGTGHFMFAGIKMSSAQLLLCYFVFSGLAAGLVYLQRSNPLLKHNFLVFSVAMALVSVFEGTELMLKILPLATLGMLLVSGISYALFRRFWGPLKQDGRKGNDDISS